VSDEHPQPWSVWYADLDPPVGHEQGGDRLVVVVASRSGLKVGRRLGLVTVVPLTSKPKGWGWRVATELGGVRGEAMPEQIRTISVQRLRRPHGDALKPDQIEGIRAMLSRLIDVDFYVRGAPRPGAAPAE
jgi:mRNA interferase MazF